MTRDKFIKLLEENIEPNAEMNFLICDCDKPLVAFLEIDNVCMNADVDDERSCNEGGVVFTIEKVLME